ncbi:MAG TPA: DUF1573 domain-containing protein [Chthoniobacteraceae bacterium]|jgi:hypothetical protein
MLRAALPFFLFATAASAQLKWDNPVQEFHRTPEDRFVETRFTFRNAGTQPVTIKKVRTTCGCTSAVPDKKSYGPGETGDVKVKFTFGSRIGQQRKTATVITDAEQQPTVLDLRVWVQEPLTIQPALVFWRIGEAADAKEVRLTASGAPIRVTSVTSSNPQLIASLQAVEEGKSYVVSVRPKDTARKETAELTLETNHPPDAPRRYRIHARIK